MNDITQIIAGPGTGKTTFLVKKSIEALQDEKCNGIIISTFTKKSAEELKYRISDSININLIDSKKKILIGTIHSVCYELISNYSEDPLFEIIPEDKLVNFIYSKINNLGFSADEIRKSGWKISSDMAQVFALLTDFQIDPDRVDFGNDYLNEICSVYKTYLKILSRNKLYDFATLQSSFLHKMQSDESFKIRILKDYNYFFIDEYQDVNNIQDLIFTELCAPNTSLCVVGDDDQSIYGFRGADSSHILNFSESRLNVNKIYLSNNYRSTNNIVRYSNHIINNSTHPRLDKSISSNRKVDGKLPLVISFASDIDEFSYIADQINKFVVEKKIRYSDIAVLMKSVKSSSAVISKAFADKLIPHVFTSLGGLLKTPYGSEFLALIDFYISNEIDSEDKFILLINEIDNLYPNNNIYNFHISNNTIDKINVLQKSKISSCIGLTYAIFESCDFISRYSKFAINIGQITDISSSFDQFNAIYDPYRFYSYLNYLSRNNVIDEINENDDAVNVMTIHQSKGLEFPVVFLASQNIYQTTSSLTNNIRDVVGSKLVDGEDRRLFYVAMTRAKDYLYITSSASKTGKVKSYVPNQYFDELKLLSSTEQDDDKNTFDINALSLTKTPSNIKNIKISYNQLKTYKICPRLYEFQNIFRLKTEMIGGLEFGSNVHRVIEAILRQIKLGTFDSNDFEDIFDDNWVNSNIRTPAENRKYRTAGYEQIEIFLNSFISKLSPDDILSIEEPFDVKINEHLNLIGRYDAILNINGSPTILDFKTGDIADYTDQLSFYKYSFEKAALKDINIKAYNLKLNMFVEIIPRDANSINNEILLIADGIRSNIFNAKPSKYCKDCAYRKLCPDKI